MSLQRTILAVHAHPDDEASSTGGILARYADEGATTVVVTCTNGEFGDGPGGVKPGQDGHDIEEVVGIRRRELQDACRTLGVTHVEMLGYHDSGMADWTFKDREDVFANVPIDTVAARLVEVFERYRPDVVITYEQDGLYDHPDHVHVSRTTTAAVEACGIPSKLYYSTIRGSSFAKVRQSLIERGLAGDWPEPDEAMRTRMQQLEARVTTVVDVSQWMERKRDALRAHASQTEQSFFNQLPSDVFDIVFAEESFVRVRDTTGAPVPETDLLAGLR